MNLWTRLLPRWANQFVAYFLGRYWLPCKRCERMHGGHEFEYSQTFFSGGTGWVNCPWCRQEGYSHTPTQQKSDLIDALFKRIECCESALGEIVVLDQEHFGWTCRGIAEDALATEKRMTVVRSNRHGR